MSQDDWNDGFIVGVIAGAGSVGSHTTTTIAGEVAVDLAPVTRLDSISFSVSSVSPVIMEVNLVEVEG